MRRLAFLLMCALLAMPLFAQVVCHFNLRTQYRHLSFSFTESHDTLYLHWAMPRGSQTYTGSYAMSPACRQHATRLCYVQPTPGQTIVTPSEELFCLLSRDALDALHATGQCRFNNTSLHLLETVPLSDGSINSTLLRILPDSNADGLASARLLHLKDFDEGYELWVLDSPRLPLITRMLNNPVEIDWQLNGQL